MSWWTHDRFGLFIHWGLYAMPARHEWVKSREKMSDEHYNRYKNLFNPDLYNPEEWAYMAKAAGVKYMVFTTKHHDGFCMWDSKYTDYKITNTPYKKDVLKPLVNAFRNEGIRIGFYYSLLDWHHPDFTIDRNHPQMPQNPELLKELNKNRNMAKYREYMKNQLTELLTEFGQIDELFMDYTYAEGENGKNSKDWDAEVLIKSEKMVSSYLFADLRINTMLKIPEGMNRLIDSGNIIEDKFPHYYDINTDFIPRMLDTISRDYNGYIPEHKENSIASRLSLIHI